MKLGFIDRLSPFVIKYKGAVYYRLYHRKNEIRVLKEYKDNLLQEIFLYNSCKNFYISTTVTKTFFAIYL